jgi:hypothetical protein
VYGGTILPKAYNMQDLELLKLDEKANPARRGHTEGSASNSKILKNLNLYLKWFYGINQEDGGHVFFLNNQRQNFSCQCSFKLLPLPPPTWRPRPIVSAAKTVYLASHFYTAILFRVNTLPE